MDRLTGLPEYEEFIEMAQEIARKHRERCVMLSTDITNFKFINRIYGHEQGNQLIRDFCQVVTQQFGVCLIATRPYSDHIVALFQMNENMEMFMKRINHIHQNFIKQNKEKYPLVSLHFNTGIYAITNHLEKVEDMVDKANIARRSMKGNYALPCALFQDELLQRDENSALLLRHFEKALETHKIIVLLQPKMDIQSKKIVGAEALSRIPDGEGGIVPPDEFIPVLEHSGKIVELDMYVIQYVFSLLAAWKKAGKKIVPISINLSKLHFYYDHLAERIIEEFQEYDLEPRFVEFEVTESVFFEETSLIIATIQQLRDYGFKVSMDDFGAGYSSLNLISILPVDIVKIDKGFIKNSLYTARGRDVMRGLIGILNQIDLEIICEGIETEEEEQIIYEYGCKNVQGFLYDRPISIRDFEDKYISL